MHEFIIFTIGGLATASIYAITASGLTLTYATTGIFNWSHGAIGMLAAFAYWQLHVGWGWNAILSLAICLLVLAPLLGIILEVGVMRRLEGTSEAAKLVVTLALALAMVGVAQWIWNPQTFRTLTPLFAGDTLVLGPIRISYNDLIVLGVALLVAIGLRLLLYRTRMGVTMRAIGRRPQADRHERCQQCPQCQVGLDRGMHACRPGRDLGCADRVALGDGADPLDR